MENLLLPFLATAEAAGEDGGKSLGYLLGLLVGSIVFLLLLILKLRVQAFLALIMASLFVAIGSGMPLVEIGDKIVASMGSNLGFIATIIGIGAIFGAILDHSGGVESLARSTIKAFGESRAPIAMLLTGFIISVPVFLDVALVIIAPIVYALARKTGKSVLHFGLPLVAGMGVTHAFVPPTPGPVFVAFVLGVNLGWVILLGCAVGLPTAIIAGLLLPKHLTKNIHIDPPENIEGEQEAKGNLPSIGTILLLIGLPILLIVTGTVIKESIAAGVTFDVPEGATANEIRGLRNDAVATAIGEAPVIQQSLLFVGHPMIALLFATLGALAFLGFGRGANKDELLEVMTKALGPAGLIILITGAGGVFKGILKESGVADALEQAFASTGISVLLLAWVFATLVRIAQGSATVAMVTAAGLMISFVDGLSQPQLALIVIAIAAGATGFSHFNDSGFWIINRYFRMSEKQTLQTWSIISIVISVVGYLLAQILWFVV
ncbi:MAG: gluconate:H+ symporter [Verrucomicrobiota bacterium]